MGAALENDDAGVLGQPAGARSRTGTTRDATHDRDSWRAGRESRFFEPPGKVWVDLIL
jgi:hypothetical protein